MSRKFSKIYDEVDEVYGASNDMHKAKMEAAAKIKCAEIIAEAIQGIYTGEKEE